MQIRSGSGGRRIERRRHGGLTEKELDEIRETIQKDLLKAIYEEIGRSVVKKVLWIGGAILAAIFAWIKLKGS